MCSDDLFVVAHREVDTVLKLTLKVLVEHYRKDDVCWMHYLAGWLVHVSMAVA